MNVFELIYLMYVVTRIGVIVGVLLIVVGLGRIFGPRVLAWVRARRRVGRQVPASDEALLDLGYSAGVVKVGD